MGPGHRPLGGDESELGFGRWSWSVFLHSLRGFASKQFVAGLIWAVLCGYVNSLSQVYVDRRHWAHFTHGEYKPLPDIGFVLLPELNVARLPDIYNLLIVVGTMFPVLIFHPHKVKVFRRYAAIQGTCFLLRSLTIMATILPNPYSECIDSTPVDEIPFLEAFRVMAGLRITCGDVLYSGHAANFTLMAMIWQEYGKTFTDYATHPLSPVPAGHIFSQLELGIPVATPMHLDQSAVDSVVQQPTDKYSHQWFVSTFFPRLFWSLAVVGYMIIIACRFHYTVDVLVGIVVVAKQWGLYHMIIRTPRLLVNVPFLQWYEGKGVYRAMEMHSMQPTIYDKVRDEQDNESEWGFEPTPRGGLSIA